jgi:hypothetical protein
MTDARFPERWLNDRRVLRLPDDAFRLFVLSLAWSVANQTDGRIYDDDLALIPASSAGSGQLAKSGLWERVADYWRSPCSRTRRPPAPTWTTWPGNAVSSGTRNGVSAGTRLVTIRCAARNAALSPRTSPGTYHGTRLGQDRPGTYGSNHLRTCTGARPAEAVTVRPARAARPAGITPTLRPRREPPAAGLVTHPRDHPHRPRSARRRDASCRARRAVQPPGLRRLHAGGAGHCVLAPQDRLLSAVRRQAAVMITATARCLDGRTRRLGSRRCRS